MPPSHRLALSTGWRFARFGPMPDGTVRPEPSGLEQPGCDDTAWEPVRLPHDWGIAGPFRAELPNRTGKLPWAGLGWYRCQLPAATAARSYLDIEGAMSNAEVWLDGHPVGGWPYGYTAFRLDLTPFRRRDRPQVLAIRLDNPPESSRWYPGGGLYRRVWLVEKADVHLAEHGLRPVTRHLSPEKAELVVSVTVENHRATPVEVSLEVILHASAIGEDVLSEVTDMSLPGSGQATAAVTFHLKNPRLWDLKTPHLYQLQALLQVEGETLDVETTTCGLRTATFTAEDGFHLNGRRVPLQGVCLHQELGCLGVAVHPDGLERQLDLLAELGANAVRIAHNPPAPELLDLCDRRGFLVIAEAFDVWAMGKTPRGYHEHFAAWHERDLRALIRRAAHHPSIILWSTGNEVLEQDPPEAQRAEAHALARLLAAIVHAEDPTRPVTVGCSKANAAFNGFHEALDVYGVNYRTHLYAEMRAAHPRLPFYGSETASTCSSRGEYFFPLRSGKADGNYRFHVSSYDLFGPPWSNTPEEEFARLEAAPFVAGEFVWTGFDYLGEPTPYNKDETNLLNFHDPEEQAAYAKVMEALGQRPPARSSYFGILDLAGFPKDRFYLYQARWRPDLPVAHLLPHWTWPERLGLVTPVHLYTNGDAAELFLNGRSLGRREAQPGQYRLRWDEVAYEPGTLQALVWRQGKPWAEATVRTAGSPISLQLALHRPLPVEVAPGTLLFVSVALVDAAGVVHPRADRELEFRVSGPARLRATDNGDPTDLTAFSSPIRRSFHGRALAVVEVSEAPDAPIVLQVTAEGLPAASVLLHR